MARKKNAKRQHFVAPWTSDDKKPAEEDYLPLAKWIPTIEDDSDEDTDDVGYYDGDGNTETILNGRSEKWNFEGTYDPDDKAQALIAGMKRVQTDDGRKLWHKIIETDGETVEGVAKAMEIKAGSGDATEYEEFSGHLDYVRAPEVKPSVSK
ncbi:phage tail protein [Latilactobacillus curvatus]|uniref:phage tail tube protein n=1 Tax=Latilactobacillus curvatus TaxID=28038 RepID=UPI0021A4C474|nr:phage tail protein [Latilactobacillus curvatus]MCT3528226.1 phage tail protein [Latilactobacillus curvatus]